MKMDHRDATRVIRMIFAAKELNLYPDNCYVPIMGKTKNGTMIQLEGLYSIEHLIRLAMSGWKL